MRAAFWTLPLIALLAMVGCREKPELGSLFDDQIIALSFAAPVYGGNDPPGSARSTITPGLKCTGQHDTYDVGIVNNTGRLNTDALIYVIAEHNLDVVRRTGRKDYAIANSSGGGPCYTKRAH